MHFYVLCSNESCWRASLRASWAMLKPSKNKRLLRHLQLFFWFCYFFTLFFVNLCYSVVNSLSPNLCFLNSWIIWAKYEKRRIRGWLFKVLFLWAVNSPSPAASPQEVNTPSCPMCCPWSSQKSLISLVRFLWHFLLGHLGIRAVGPNSRRKH